MIKNKNRGFTLIELLVVIAIIGILASVVLIATNSTRARGNDSAIQSNLGTVKLQAEMVNLSNKCYGDSNASPSECDTSFTPTGDCSDSLFSIDTSATPWVAATTPLDSILTKALMAAIKSSGQDGTSVVSCAVGGAGSASYAIAIPLKTNALDSWCIDSEGYSDLVLSSSQITTDATSGKVSCTPK